MSEANRRRGEVLMAGIGWMGVLVAGQTLLVAASKKYRHVSYVPSYGMAKRGGLCECTVIFSEGRIASPVINQAQAVVILDSSQFKAFESRVRPGGIIIVEQAGLAAESANGGYTLYALPGMEIAVSMGSSLVNNLIMLGAYVSIAGTVPADLIEWELSRRFGENQKQLVLNTEAFKRGLSLGEKYMASAA
jgi:2-oxoglutarate ferredoxin oxidoreductase subunit gamma